MTSATAYLRSDRYYVHSNSQTRSGFWIFSKPCFSLPSSCKDDELGRAVRAALSASQIDVPDPDRDAALLGPLLAMANVKSWRAFAKNALCVNLDGSESKISFTPTARDSKAAFHHLNDLTTVVIASEGTEGIGMALRSAFSRAA